MKFRSFFLKKRELQTISKPSTIQESSPLGGDVTQTERSPQSSQRRRPMDHSRQQVAAVAAGVVPERSLGSKKRYCFGMFTPLFSRKQFGSKDIEDIVYVS